MTELSRREPQYDAFLFASVCETDDMTLSVVSLLARQNVDPWQEASRLSQLSRAQATNSLAATIWKSDSAQWSPSEASIIAVRLIDLLPSHARRRPTPPWANDSSGRLTFWVVAGILFMSIAISGNSMQREIKNSGAPIEVVSQAAQNATVAPSSRGMETD
ncbi:hypothetical protein IVA98_27265 [Bradyrhizobium sp. 160]|uniref:hypothetical protein n=1 Tax=Bradyrhizobium sp. 160 TaxID=2782634 RepID=UPI001FFB4BB1|nr:hypothetical protein [Bradyrhizobium sp. 160]MCK1626786.1 hypothetical protein [Bradyrhizobium sp. 160]